ncbi:GTPase Era, mitochondrial [Teleopsis dalmanni]|uniref:GTPase Era, mitochondrial n=1 Tax=Teleopsis dalmanni TaxID=139649 RepID=UPI0018CD418E|nr:GTPase Era, mitochondrial [Teleopsis dalmanni]
MQLTTIKLFEITKISFFNKAAINRLTVANIRSYALAANKQTDSSIDQSSEQERTKSSVAEQRLMNIAVIGVPNAGKSTFINNLIQHRICPTSSKVHTTRDLHKAIYTTGNTQLIFYDTPGLVTSSEIKKHNLNSSSKSFKISAYKNALKQADIIAVMHDVSKAFTRKQIHTTVLDTLRAYPNVPSFLILNKIDALKSKRVLLELIRILTNGTLSGRRKLKGKSDDANKEELVKSVKSTENWSHFKDVFMVSSLTGSGLSDIHDYLLNMAKPQTWKYASDIYTDYTPETLIVESVRARLLDYLPQEIPYTLKSELEYYNEENNIIYASVQVLCPTTRLERLICGESNGRLRQITERVTSDLVETFGKPISLTIATHSQTK